jgi:protein Mpv17
MEGHSWPAIQKKYVDLYPPAIKANWTVWPLIQFVNFRFMPLPYRVPFQASCGVFWTLYLSLLNSSKPTQAEESARDLKHSAEKAADKLVETTHALEASKSQPQAGS